MIATTAATVGFFQASPEEALTLKTENLLPTVQQVLAEQEMELIRNTTEVIENEDHRWVSTLLYINADAKKVAELNVALVLKLMDHPPELTENIVLRFAIEENQHEQSL